MSESGYTNFSIGTWDYTLLAIINRTYHNTEIYFGDYSIPILKKSMDYWIFKTQTFWKSNKIFADE